MARILRPLRCRLRRAVDNKIITSCYSTMLSISRTILLKPTSSVNAVRSIANIPVHENHIRFDPKVGRKRPSQDVLDRFKRLNNGMWIRAHPGRSKLRYTKDDTWQKTSLYYETCTKDECEMLDKMMTPFWLRQKHYPNDPYKAYHVRHGITSPRVDDKGKFVRERPKVLLDDLTSEKYFYDR